VRKRAGRSTCLGRFESAGDAFHGNYLLRPLRLVQPTQAIPGRHRSKPIVADLTQGKEIPGSRLYIAPP
jgi:hypothetical protein